MRMRLEAQIFLAMLATLTGGLVLFLVVIRPKWSEAKELGRNLAVAIEKEKGFNLARNRLPRLPNDWKIEVDDYIARFDAAVHSVDLTKNSYLISEELLARVRDLLAAGKRFNLTVAGSIPKQPDGTDGDLLLITLKCTGSGDQRAVLDGFEKLERNKQELVRVRDYVLTHSGGGAVSVSMTLQVVVGVAR